jgi:hypothetical protein
MRKEGSKPNATARTLVRELRKLGHTIEYSKALDLVGKIRASDARAAKVTDSEGLPPESETQRSKRGEGPIAIEFVSSDPRALEWSYRSQVLSFQDNFFDWLSTHDTSDEDDDVLEHEDGEGSSRWLSANELLSAAVAKDGRFTVESGDEFYLIGEDNLRWEPTSDFKGNIEPDADSSPSP